MINTNALKVKQVLRVLKNDAKSKVAKLSFTTYTDKQYCYDTLNEVSRSFAMVIQDLPADVKDAICVFYLVLRALDTIEDDMNLPMDEKLTILSTFHEKCGNLDFCLEGIGDKEVYVNLLRNYPRVNAVYNELAQDYQKVIKEITYEMARGMQFFIEKEIRSKKDYDLYCHYVAGLVGQGLSKIFVTSGLESPSYLLKSDISNSMGLFLQKTNITRDFYEDIDAGRIFWPKEIWENYVVDIKDLKNNTHRSVACLNKMVENAFNHSLDCIDYLAGLENKQIFRFCAIPQLMAIGTLSLVYNKHKSLLENVKMDKAETMQIFTSVNTIQDFAKIALSFVERFNLNESDVAFEIKLNQIKVVLQKYV